MGLDYEQRANKLEDCLATIFLDLADHTTLDEAGIDPNSQPSDEGVVNKILDWYDKTYL